LENDTLVPRRGFSCSQQAMPFVKDKMKTFHGFASASLAESYSEPALEKALKLEANTLESGVLLNDGQGKFSFASLPRLVQISPGFGPTITEVNGDGVPDLLIAQNFFTPQRETGRMDGGLSQLLLGRGDGTFEPVPVKASGLAVPGDAKSLVRLDLNEDHRPDVLVARNDDTAKAFLHAGRSGEWLSVKLRHADGKTPAVGARVTVIAPDGTRSLHEIATGGGYLSQQSATLFLPRTTVDRLEIRWPNGRTSEAKPSAASGEWIVKAPASGS
jgi:hypothetical protein